MGAVCCCNDDGSKSEVVESMPVEPSVGLIATATPEPAEVPPKVLITIMGARGLRDTDWKPAAGNMSQCRCEVKCGGILLKETEALCDTAEPVWMEDCKVNDIADDADLEFFIYDKDTQGDHLMGKAVLKAEDYTLNGFNGQLELEDSEQAFVRVKVKLANKDLLPGPTPEFTMCVERSSMEISFGLHIDRRDGIMLQILKVLSGPFEDYNRDAKPDYTLQVKDFLGIVNGFSGSADRMLEELKHQIKVNCVVRRAVCVNVIFDRGEAKLPLDLEFCEFQESIHADYLVIKTVGDTVKPIGSGKNHEKLYPGDRITAVDGSNGSCVELKEMLEKHNGKVQLEIWRPATGYAHGAPETCARHWSYL